MFSFRHGAAFRGKASIEYRTWCGIKDRCYRPGAKAWKYYGGRGITMCERWLHNFQAFVEDMGLRPSAKHSIDRINNDGNYEPENCRWATASQQRQNQRQRKRKP